MADIKISALPGASTLTGAETIPLVQGGTTKKVTTDQFLIKDGSGNVGLGVTPSAWGAYKAMQIGQSALMSRSGGSDLYLLSNNYFDGTNFRYINSTLAARYTQDSGQHQWFTAPSGTAGNAISFTQAMTLDAAGNLGLGVTPSAWHTNFKALQIGTFGSISTNALHTSATAIANMAYASGEYTWTYTTTGLAAARYEQLLGSHTWFTAPSGTAGNPISFTQAMTLDASGNLLVNRAASSGLGKLNVDGGADFTNGNVYIGRDSGNLLVGTTSAVEKLTLTGRAFLADQAAPATPTGGGVIYVEAGALKYKGSSGTVTILAAA